MSIIGIEGNQGSMSRVLVMPVEGIIRKEVGGQINTEGFYLYRTLQSMYRVILTTFDGKRGPGAGRLVDWLTKEGVFGYDDILYGDMCINTLESYWSNMIRILRTRGYNISMVVVNSPQDALDVLNAHVPVLLFGQPAYGLPEWLPGSRRGAEAWDSLVGKIETEREARRSDRRMDAELT